MNDEQRYGHQPPNPAEPAPRVAGAASDAADPGPGGGAVLADGAWRRPGSGWPQVARSARGAGPARPVAGPGPADEVTLGIRVGAAAPGGRSGGVVGSSEDGARVAAPPLKPAPADDVTLGIRVGATPPSGQDGGDGRSSEDGARGAAPALKPAPGDAPGPVSAREAGGRRFVAVDGLRGAAVLAVLLHDTGARGPYVSWAGAGVDVLLVLTGFLTTLPLLRGATATGRTGVVGFLARRTKRLVPALLVAVAMTLAVCWALGSAQVVRGLAGEASSVLQGRGGWAEWVRGRPLGVVPTMDAPLAPLWLWEVAARSVLVWSLLLAGLCLLARRRLAPVALVVALLAGAATVAAAWGVLPGVDVVTGMRTLALPAGSAAACLVHLAERGGRTVSRPAAVLLTATGLVAGAVLAVSAVLLGGGHGGDRYVVAAVVSAAALTGVLCGGRGLLPRLLSGGLLTEVGRMSYSLFLLHLPVYWLLRRGQPGLGSLSLFLVGGAVTWFLALLVHYLLVERLAARPWGRGRLGRRVVL